MATTGYIMWLLGTLTMVSSMVVESMGDSGHDKGVNEGNGIVFEDRCFSPFLGDITFFITPHRGVCHLLKKSF